VVPRVSHVTGSWTNLFRARTNLGEAGSYGPVDARRAVTLDAELNSATYSGVFCMYYGVLCISTQTTKIYIGCMYNAKAYSAASATSPLASTTIPRRDPTEHNVQIEILFCGICHSDLHVARNEWNEFMSTTYPIVPGHEIVGRVTKVGSAVTKFKTGDLAAIGCIVDADGTCGECRTGLAQFCPNLTLAFGMSDKHLGGVTYGGYSDSIVVDQRFVLRVPANLNLADHAREQNGKGSCCRESDCSC
jgi:hypothetical protein